MVEYNVSNSQTTKIGNKKNQRKKYIIFPYSTLFRVQRFRVEEKQKKQDFFFSKMVLDNQSGVEIPFMFQDRKI